MQTKTNFLTFSCRLSNADVALLASRNKLSPLQENMVRTMMADFVQKVKIHVYYKQHKESQVQAVMTLGTVCDNWCESYLKEGELWKGYMADQIAMCGLMSGYEIFRNVLKKQYGTCVSQPHFWDEEKEETSIVNALTLLKQDEVTIRDSGQMNPLKSVLFTIDILEGENGDMSHGQMEKGMCHACENISCPNRVTDS